MRLCFESIGVDVVYDEPVSIMHNELEVSIYIHTLKSILLQLSGDYYT